MDQATVLFPARDTVAPTVYACEPDPDAVASEPRASRAWTAGVGALVSAWTFFDGFIIGGPLLVVAEAGGPLAAFLAGTVAWTLMNLLVCAWINRQWQSWVTGSRVEAKLHKIRDGRLARRPVAWISRGSPVWFALAAIALTAGQVVVLFRLATGRATSKAQEIAAAFGEAVVFSAFFLLVR